MNKKQKEVQQVFLDNEKAVLKKLEDNYKDALDEINDKIAILLGRQDADMQHVIYQVEYQRALRTQVQAILENLQANEFETISQYLTQSYEDGFIGTMYDLQGQGIPLVFPLDQEQVVAAIQHETKLSEDLYRTLGRDIKDLSKQIAGEISRGLSGGHMYSEIARNIASWARIPKNNAMRIARTEAHRIQCKATADAQFKAKEKGADIVKQWDSSLDRKTRANHRKLDGQIRELEEPFEVAGMEAMMPGGFGRASEDINCRCALLQRARWALGNDYTKWDEDAPVIIDDDGTTQFVKVDAKSFKEFKGYYKDITGQMTMNLVNVNSDRVRSSTQKIKSQGTLEKTGKSSIIKAITVDDLVKATEGGAVKQDVAKKIGTILEKHGALKLFDKIKTANLGDNIVFQTNPERVGTFFDVVFEINEDVIGGKSIKEIDQLFKGAGNTICNSLEDAIIHETYHAKLIKGLNYAQVKNLYAELEEIHIEGLSKTAYKDGAECIAEVGVLIERGDKDKVPKAALELFERYTGEK